MPRHKNDGLGRIGGRQKGTPNKEKSIKSYLRAHSETYFTPNIEEVDENGIKTGRILSQYELDLQQMKATDRVNAELSLLKFHTPQMQATAVDMSLSEENNTLSDRLKRLSNGEEIESNQE